MSKQDLERRYEEVKKTIALISGALTVPLVNYGIFIQSKIWCTNSMIIFGGISFCFILIWIAEIIDC